ncbi:hypothetical protein A6K24_23155 [Metabacillus litoralis]|uniref:Uncharacterized protein n=1 Tax=Metabacillus litoralis TaxID=152268 RepID=A0A179SXQ7_9BACI|nr:hypothetical protein A6K24_23155 [Metabacillus litoralis]
MKIYWIRKEMFSSKEVFNDPRDNKQRIDKEIRYESVFIYLINKASLFKKRLIDFEVVRS